MNNFRKNILIWIIGLIIISIGFNMVQSIYSNEKYNKLNLSQFLNKIENSEIKSIVIQDREIRGQLSDGSYYRTYAGFDYSGAIDKAHKKQISVEIKEPDNRVNILLSIFISWFPMILFIGLWVFFMKQANGGGGKGPFGFGKSKARMNSDKSPKVTFADVAGIDEAKEEMYEMVEFLKEPVKFQILGGRIPRGCLLIGPPGTGKTLLARAIAGEAGVPFFSISGSDFVEMFVGVGASRVRDMFEQAKKHAPCIIFIDEIDAVGRSRGVGLGGGNDEREQTLNQMLVEMDGFDRSQGIIVIAATNRPDVLDSALLRPGRFDRQIAISNPDIKGRQQILEIYLKKIKASSDIDVKLLARATPGFSGAEISNLVNEAALLAARLNQAKVEMKDLQKAKDKIMMGSQRKSMMMTEYEKKLTAYHEAGHALVALHCPHSDPIYKATIIPTNMALGMVIRLPENDRVMVSKNKLIDDLAVAMGGRAAEEIIFGHGFITTGASSDIKSATSLAKKMVRKWGMSDLLGPVDCGEAEDSYKISEYSEETNRKIESEISKFVIGGFERAKDILSREIEVLHKIANQLISRETLTGDELRELAGIFQEKEETQKSPIHVHGINENINDASKFNNSDSDNSKDKIDDSEEQSGT